MLSPGFHRWLPAYPPGANPPCLGLLPQPPAPLLSVCGVLTACLPGGARGRRSSRGWGHSCSSPGLCFLPRPWASGAEEAQAGRPELPPAREAHERHPPTTILPSEPQPRGSPFGTILRLWVCCSTGPPASPPGLTVRPEDAPPPSRELPLPGDQGPGTHLHAPHHSESPSCSIRPYLLVRNL